MATQQEAQTYQQMMNIVHRREYGYDSKAARDRDNIQWNQLGGDSVYQRLSSTPEIVNWYSSIPRQSDASMLGEAATTFGTLAGGYAGLSGLGTTGTAGTYGAADAGAEGFTGIGGAGGSGLGTTSAGGLGGLASSSGSTGSGLLGTNYTLGNLGKDAIGVGLPLYSANQADQAAKEASKLATDATDRATIEQARQFNIGQANQAPWLNAGKGSLAAQLELMGLSGDPAAQMEALKNSPGYQYRYDLGNNAVNNKLAAMGSRGGSRALQSAIDYNQNFASNEYGNRLNQLGDLSRVGQNTATNTASQGASYANNLSDLWTNNATYSGAAGIAGANARQSGLMGAANYLTNKYW